MKSLIIITVIAFLSFSGYGQIKDGSVGPEFSGEIAEAYGRMYLLENVFEGGRNGVIYTVNALRAISSDGLTTLAY